MTLTCIHRDGMPPKGGKEGRMSKLAGDGTATERPKVFPTRSAKAGLQVCFPLSRALPQLLIQSVAYFFRRDSSSLLDLYSQSTS